TSQFHRLIRSQPTTARKAITATRIATPFATLRIFITSPSQQQPFVPCGLQPRAQVRERVALARDERVDAHSAARGELAERHALELLRHEHRALLRRQL